jgi:hypothetical protein
MILAHRIPHLTDQVLKNTLGAAEPSERRVDWLTLAEITWLEQRLQALQQRLLQGTAHGPRAA